MKVLNLQCREVIGLHLEDIDLAAGTNQANGTISLTGTRGWCADVLPLPRAASKRQGEPVG